ncbi:MAG: response regulator [Anaerolineae bacterium]|nr:response regulator [Anaerolineae bacterium]
MKRNQDIRVLIVDDDYLAGEMIVEVLREGGFNIVGRVSDGSQAIEMVTQYAGTPSQPDVVLMDIEMPNMDGIEATRLIQERCPMPVVMLTAYETPDLVTLAGEVGAGAYLVKPPNPREVERTIIIAMARFDDMLKLRNLNDELQTRNEELQEALAQIKTLRGLLPICANCKKIRDDDGYWQDVAVYIRDHSEAEFSHGLCPDCAAKLYPEFYKNGEPQD